jgi:hypothetical protein
MKVIMKIAGFFEELFILFSPFELLLLGILIALFILGI